MSTVETTELTVSVFKPPASADAPDARDLHDFVALDAAVCIADTGSDHLVQTAEEMLPGWLDQTDRTRRGFLARRGGRLVGAVSMGFANEPGSTAGDFDLLVAPDEWGTGIEDALVDAAEAATRELGRTTVQSWSLHPVAEDPNPFVPRTGWGKVTQTKLAQFLASRGYVLEQVERNSIFDLRGSVDFATAKLAEAQAAAGDDYRLVS